MSSKPLSLEEIHPTSPEQLPLVLTTKEVAALLRVCTKTIYTMVERKILQARKVGNGKRDLRFDRDSVLSWLRSPQSATPKK